MRPHAASSLPTTDTPTLFMCYLSQLQPDQKSELLRYPFWYCIPLCSICYLVLEDIYREVVASAHDSLDEEKKVQGNIPQRLKDLYYLEQVFDYNIRMIRSAQEKSPSNIAARILRNYEILRPHMQISQRRYRGVLDTNVSLASLEESKRSIEQAGKVSQLNRLAFVFLPLSLVTSFFGMNVTELNGNVRIWVFFVAAIVLTAFVLIVAWNPASWGKNRWHTITTNNWLHLKARQRIRMERTEANNTSHELKITGHGSGGLHSSATSSV